MRSTHARQSTVSKPRPSPVILSTARRAPPMARRRRPFPVQRPPTICHGNARRRPASRVAKGTAREEGRDARPYNPRHERFALPRASQKHNDFHSTGTSFTTSNTTGQPSNNSLFSSSTAGNCCAFVPWSQMATSMLEADLAKRGDASLATHDIAFSTVNAPCQATLHTVAIAKCF